MARSRSWFRSGSAVGLALAMVLATVVIPTLAATSASANLNTPLPANADGEPQDVFRSSDSLWVTTLSDVQGGRVCIVAATGDSGCDSAPWGGPANRIVGVGTTISPIAGPPLQAGTWRLRSENEQGKDNWVEASTSEVFTVQQCEPGECLDSLGAAEAAAFKAAANQSLPGAKGMCTLMKVLSKSAAAMEFGMALLEGDYITAAVSGAALFDFEVPSVEGILFTIGQNLACRVNDMYQDIANDPPDPQYTAVAEPARQTITGAQTEEQRAYLQASADQLAFGTATLTSYERYQGALAAGDKKYQGVQARAIAKLGAGLVDAMARTAVTGRALAASTDSLNIAATSRISFADQAQLDEATAVVQRIRTSGLNSSEGAALTALGIDAAGKADFAARVSEISTADVGIGETMGEQLTAQATELDQARGQMDLFVRSAGSVASGLSAVQISFTAVDADPAGSVLFTASATSPAGNPLKYSWDFGDGQSSTVGAVVTHAFAATGDYAVTVTATEDVPAGLSATSTKNVSVSVPIPNAPPIAADDSLDARTAADAVVNVLLNDSDPEGQPLKLASNGNPAHGAVTCTPDGDCTYRSNAGYQGSDSFSYVASDGAKTSTATVNVAVAAAPQDLPPVVGDDTATVVGGRSVGIDVLANDSDPAGEPLTIDSSTAPGHGTADCPPAGPCTYSADATYSGVDSFRYTVSDAQGQTTTGTVTVTVTPADAAPTARPDAASIVAGVASPVAVLDNDSGVTALRLLSSTAPAHGRVSCPDADGACVYTSVVDYAGLDEFSYTVSDENGRTATGIVTLTVRINRPPVTAGDVLRANAGVTSDVDVLANDSDPEGQTLIAVNAGSPAHGSVQCGGAVCSYTPAEGFTGTDQFTYAAQDSDGATTIGVVQVNVVYLDIASDGPLTLIRTSDDLNCNVRHVGDTSGSWFGNTACGTFVQAGGVLYGPAIVPAGGGATTAAGYTPFIPVSHSERTGTGTAADPYRLAVKVALGGSGLTLTQSDSYVVGSESYRTDVKLENSGGAVDAVIYRAGDCFLQDSDFGIGRVDAQGPACAALPQSIDPNRILGMYPLTSGSTYLEAAYNTVWETIGGQKLFDNTCLCNDPTDNGIGLSWPARVPANGSASVSHLTVFSPTGTTPVVFTKVADAPAAEAGGTDGYTVTLNNSGATAVTLESIVDTLPVGFAYIPGSGSLDGASIGDPTVSGRQVTWSGAFTVPAGADNGPGKSELRFKVAIAADVAAGTYTNSVTGSGAGAGVVGAESVAPIQVTPAAANRPPTAVITPASPSGAEGAAIEVSGSSSTDPEGGALSYAWDLDNDGAFDDGAAVAAVVTVPVAGSQVIRLRVTDPAGNTAEARTTVVAGNVNPVVSVGPDRTTLLDLLTVTGSFVDPGADTWTATVDWGEGAAPEPLTLDGTAFLLNHRYQLPGDYRVTVTVTDTVGRGSGTDSLIVTIPRPAVNLPPTATLDPGAPSGTEGSSIPVRLQAVDPEGAAVTALWSWSATPLQTSVPNCTLSAASINGATIVCDDNGEVTLSVSVSDGTQTTIRTAPVHVTNGPPILGQLVVPSEIDLGQSLSLSVPFSDTGAADTHTCSVLAGGQTVVGTITGGVCSAAIPGLPVGQVALTVTVTDDDGGSSSVAASVLVRTPPLPPACATAAPTVDVTVSADQPSASTRLTSPRISTAGPNELLLAFVASDGPAKPNQKVTGISGAGVSWTLVGRSNATWGTTEIWQAYATAKVTNALATATLAKAFDGSITVAAFKGAANRVGAVATAGATNGSPAVTIRPIKCNSMLWAVGHDWTRAAVPTAISGQTIVHQFIDRRVGDSYWTQRLDALTAGTGPIKLGVAGITNDRWNMTAVEIPGIG